MVVSDPKTVFTEYQLPVDLSEYLLDGLDVID